MRNRSLAVALLVTIAGCADDGDPPVAEMPADSTTESSALPDSIVAERGGFIPEGIEYDAATGRLLTGSLSEGSIFEIHPDGRVTPVITDADLISSVGIEVDAARNRLLVANSDRGAFDGSSQGQAKLGAYDLASGERLAMVDLGATIPDRPADATHFANDVTVTEDGTAYVTDTTQNTIYQVTPDYEASVFYRFPGSESLGLNGLVYHPSGYLLVGGGAILYKVPIADPASTTEVTLPEAVGGQDGLVWMDGDRLAITSNSESRVVVLRSNDDWASAQLAGVGMFAGDGTTAAVANGEIFVVQPHFADEEPPVVKRVVLR